MAESDWASDASSDADIPGLNDCDIDALGSPEIIPPTPPIDREIGVSVSESTCVRKRLFQDPTDHRQKKSKQTPSLSSSLVTKHLSHSESSSQSGSVVCTKKIEDILGEVKHTNSQLKDISSRLNVVEGRLKQLEDDYHTSSNTSVIKKCTVPPAVRVSNFVVSIYKLCLILCIAAIGSRSLQNSHRRNR